MDADMARDGWRELQSLARLNEDARGPANSPRLAVNALEMSWYMRNQLLNDADWAGMAHSVEIRVPLVDVHLLKATAPWFAAYPHLNKEKVVRAAAPSLPSSVLDKPKTGFVVPIRAWLGAQTDSSAGRGLRGWARTIHREQVSHGRNPSRASRCAGRKPRVLVSTIAPGKGGVSAMTHFVVRTLANRGLEPVIAHYEPYSLTPALSVPSYRLLQRRAGAHHGIAFDEREIHAIGAWLPELEFTHYAATRHWQQLMESCDAFVAASGNVLAATPFYQTGRPYLAWVATDWEGDRKDRVKGFPAARRWLDRWVNAPVLRRLEKKLLRSGHIVSLSDYTARTLAKVAGRDVGSVVLPVAVDCTMFVPNPSARVPGLIGFAGRFNDPRKNIGLLVAAAALLRRRGCIVSVVLMGDTPRPELTELIAKAGITAHVSIKPNLSREQFRDCMQALDVFVLPSHQEGLCIAALEAMSCGVPVVSTRCGGPEEFVIPNRTGEVVDFDAGHMAQAIESIIANSDIRASMSVEARRMAETRYSHARAERTFLRAFDATFPKLGTASYAQCDEQASSGLRP